MRGFSDEERERIREQLIEHGRTLFARYGLEKTTISDLTEPVGIATSTFYRFFDSKEELYVRILQREGEEIERRLRAELDAAPDTAASIRTLLEVVTEEIETNPLIRSVVRNDDLERLAAGYEGGYEEGREQSFSYLLPIVRSWIEAGEVREDVDPEVIASTLRATTMVTLHQDEIGEDLYPETRDLLIDLVAEGLVEDDDRG
ncbi:TetR/AcrR family transcriptional regulator [Salinilacihabitans rarus]|uniref:TetR/AcrR family transcriptional regulator n=1 Tax=Salinilacihabitans rarus TaxID=2961596 RepID=UPI0020C88C3B|nr:TetR/AcrR family transcriptional regulator [Salinilacihabitans rarus]